MRDLACYPSIRLVAYVRTPRCRQRGLRVVGETVASALARDESALWDPDFDRAAQFVMSPPIRSK